MVVVRWIKRELQGLMRRSSHQKRGENCQMQMKTRLKGKRESENSCTSVIDTSPSMSLIHLDNLTVFKDGGTGEGGVSETQERITDAFMAKVDANAKSDAPYTSNASNINTPKIDVNIEIVKLCVILIALPQRVFLSQQALCDTQSSIEGEYTGKFDGMIDAKKEVKKR